MYTFDAQTKWRTVNMVHYVVNGEWFQPACIVILHDDSDFIAFIFKYTHTARRIIINQLLIKCTIRTITFPQLYSVRRNPKKKRWVFVTAETSPADPVKRHVERTTKARTHKHTHAHTPNCTADNLLCAVEVTPTRHHTSILHSETNVVYLGKKIRI